jgi:hypothetical protein
VRAWAHPHASSRRATPHRRRGYATAALGPSAAHVEGVAGAVRAAIEWPYPARRRRARSRGAASGGRCPPADGGERVVVRGRTQAAGATEPAHDRQQLWPGLIPPPPSTTGHPWARPNAGRATVRTTPQASEAREIRAPLLVRALALRGVIPPGSHLGSPLNPGRAVLARGVSRRWRPVACVRADASPNEVLHP